MKIVPGIFMASNGSGTVTYGHRVLCSECNHDSFHFNVIYLTNGQHEHVTCSRCGVCFCDNQCINGDSVVLPDQVKDN